MTTHSTIRTRTLAATSRQPMRYRATTPTGESLTITSPYGTDPHMEVAQALAKQLGAAGEWFCAGPGAWGDGVMFVREPRRAFTVDAPLPAHRAP
jgi:hypothetical protein